jgi:hypothetical protein
MSSSAALLSLPVEFTLGERTVRIAPRDFEIEALFSRAVEDEAMRAITRHSGEQGAVGLAEYTALLDGWRRDCATALYEWGEWHCWRALAATKWQKKLAAIQIMKGTPTHLIDAEDFVERIWDDPQKLKAFQDAQAQADQDPNRPKPWRMTAPQG